MFKSLDKLFLLMPATGALCVLASTAIATELPTGAMPLQTDALEQADSPTPQTLALDITSENQPLEVLNTNPDVSVTDELAPVISIQEDVTSPAATDVVDTPTSSLPSESPFAIAQSVSPSASNDAMANMNSVDQLIEDSRSTPNSMGQVTSVSQLSDVRPTDWAYQALQSLVERYGCIAGYPDGTYRGNSFLTRYEFAAGLNACLDRINDLIAQGLSNVASREDLEAIQRLQEEFAAELATLRGRVDALEGRVTVLEANQFSTTTKLSGTAIFNTAFVLGEDDRFEDQATFGYRVQMNFDSSFNGRDRLRVRLQARDVPNFAGDPIGFSYRGNSSETGDVVLNNLFYDFPIGDSVNIRIGANNLEPYELVSSTISPLDSSIRGSISNFGFPPQYWVAAPGDAGAGAIIHLTDNLSLDLGYTAGSGGGTNPANPTAGQGLFNGDYSMIGQLTYLSDFVDAAVTYIHAYANDGFVSNAPEVANTYGVQANFRVTDWLELGGGVAYTPTRFLGVGDSRVWTYQGTIAFPDLFGEGNMGGILVGVPPRVADVELGGQRVPLLIEDASLLVEGFYRYQLNDHISLTPGIIWIADPGNNNDIDDTVIGALRTVFSF